MCNATLPESSAEALHISNHAFGVQETRMPTERSISEHPQLAVSVILPIFHFCVHGYEK